MCSVGCGSTGSVTPHLTVVWLADASCSAEACSWLVKGALVVVLLVVGLLVEGGGVFFRSRSRVSCRSTLMPASLFKHEPDVSGPEDKVQVAEHLKITHVICYSIYMNIPDFNYEDRFGNVKFCGWNTLITEALELIQKIIINSQKQKPITSYQHQSFRLLNVWY